MVLVSWSINGWRLNVHHRPIFPRGCVALGSHTLVDLGHVIPKGFPAHLLTKKKGRWEAQSHPEPTASLGRAHEHDFQGPVTSGLAQGFPGAEEREDEPKGGAGGQTHRLGSAFQTGFCRALGF